MEENKIDQLNKEAFMLLGYEKAPANFTSAVMENILAEKAAVVKKYRPAIGKWGWISLAIISIFIAAGLWYTSGLSAPGKDVLSASLYRQLDTAFLQPLMASIVRLGSQLELTVIIGFTATLILLADRLIAVKLKERLGFN